MDNKTIWKIIDSQFIDNPQSLVRHHIESYNDFYKTGIFQIFKEKNPITINSHYDESIKDFRHQCNMYFGGKNGDKIYFGKPVIYDNENPHYMFPNEARLRNMNYSMMIHYDIEIEYIDILEDGQKPYIVDVNMIGGTNEGGYKALELENNDYSEEINEFREQKAGNFKEKTLEQFDDEEKKKLYDGEIEGGAPKKVERKKRVKSVEVEMTTAMAEKLREVSEKSIIGSNIQKREIVLEKIFLGKFPIMVQSEYCILNGLPREVRYSMGECKNDLGGYFIIDGKEKTVVPQEKFADNMLYIREVKDDKYLYSAEIKSVSENVSKPIRTLSVKIKSPSPSYTFENIEVNIPNVRNPVPLFILFRALGVISDKEIIKMCLLDLEKYESMIDLFRPSVHDAGAILTQQSALLYIASLTKYNTISYVLEILSDYFLPHVGEINYIQKAYYLGYIVFRLLSVYQGLEQPTDRDNFKYKRVELVGSLLHDLFREYYTLQQREIHLGFEKTLYYNQSMYADNLPGLIKQNYREVLKERVVEIGFKKAFKGNWGSQEHTKRIGIVQDLNRLSFNSMISHLRKTNLPLDSSAKLVGPRVLHCSQWGFIDPIDTPDGANIGLHKSLAISTYVSRGYSREPMIQWLREKISLKLLEECGPELLSKMTRVIVNGLWAGSIDDPISAIQKIRLFRRNALIPIYTSATFEIKLNTIFIYTDSGRLCRPVFYKNDETNKLSYEEKSIYTRLQKGEFTWNDLTCGFNKKKIPEFKEKLPKIYELNELYEGIDAESNPAKLERFIRDQAIVDYIDPSESENALIAVKPEEMEKNQNKKYTHLEIHESLIFGVMCNQIIFPENNPPTRDSFSCGQSKQAISMYHTNHRNRMDKTAVVLNNGQIPLVKSRYLNHINHEENPYGENAIVAIMCYTGYNVEDAVLINEGALKRGLFNTTYYTVYESHEENSKNGDVLVDKKFTNIENESSVIGTKSGYDYSKLDKFGIIRENMLVDDKTILIGLTSNNVQNKGIRIDMSKTPKKGQLGIVDKTFITEGEEGERIAKVRIREIRIPNIGDKMASRSGQKGTVGLVVPEYDMPFTKDGLRPDIIINPHAIPSRMTIGQLVECIIGKACALYGGFGDCTAFNNKGSKIGLFGEHLTHIGFHSTGNEILYNGMTGEQIESTIFIGPTYYMRLKHMVKDKINYRARGPITALTKQPVSGRANDGGLRIGEMERDVLISHGMNNFLRESMMDRGDKYYMAVCNQTGMLAIYNPSKNLFMSPMADGPIRFIGSIDGTDTHIENVTKYGRNFSIVSVPYSFKLLMQELQTVNIQMRLITEDNIAQLENLSFSKNIEKLTHIKDITPKRIIENIKKTLEKREKIALTPMSIISPELMIAHSPDFPPPPEEYFEHDGKSPDFPPPTSEEYGESSASYSPTFQEYLRVQPMEESEENTSYSPTFQEYQRLHPMEETDEKQFNIGDVVYYRGGDQKSNRQWRIKDIGNEFYTIETDDREGIEDIGDTIRVVYPTDIYSPESVVYPLSESLYGNNNMNESSYIEQHGFSQNIHPPNEYNPYMHQVPEINVNPVIKIVNGNDNSVDTGVKEQPNQVVENNNDSILGGNINVTKENNNQKENTHENKNNNKSDFDIMSGGIDFSKLMIKKI